MIHAVATRVIRSGMALCTVAMLWGAPLPAVAAEAKEKAKAPEATDAQVKAFPISECVVSGEKLGEHGKPVVVTHEGREVLLCCGGCVKEFNADPAKYLKDLDAKIIAKQKPTYPTDVCVVSGEKLGAMGEAVDVVVKNQLVRLCCNGCKKSLAKDPDKYLAKLKEAAAKGK